MLFVAWAALALALLPGAAPAQTAAAGGDKGGAGKGWDINAYAKEEYRVRHSPEAHESDNDIHLYFNAGATDESDHYSADLSMGLWWDVDGPPAYDASPTFASIWDRHDPPVWFDVFTLSLDYHSSGKVKEFKIGRQIAEYGEPVTFDGANLVLRPVNKYVEFFAFGGRTNHFFEVDTDVFEDWIASVGVDVRPTRNLKLEAAYRYLGEDVEAREDDARESVDDHLFRLTGWWRYGDFFRLRAYFETINKEVGRTGGAFGLESIEHEMGVDVELDAQTMTFRELAEQDDPYFATLGESLPHLRYRVDAWKGYTTKYGTYGLHVGLDARQLIMGHEEQPFNRNFGRYYVLANLTDVGIKGPFATFVFERWGDSPSFDAKGLWTVGGSVGYDVKKFKAEAGTAYQRYKYEYYQTPLEIDDVRTVFVELKGKPVSWLTVSGRYEFERFDRDIHSVTLGLAQRF